jgi:hypothetical protein
MYKVSKCEVGLTVMGTTTCDTVGLLRRESERTHSISSLVRKRGKEAEMWKFLLGISIGLCDLCSADHKMWVSFFGGAFEKLLKATVTFVMSVCPSAWYNSAPTGRSFIKFDI